MPVPLSPLLCLAWSRDGLWDAFCYWALCNGKEKYPSWFFCSHMSLSPAVRNAASGTSEMVLPHQRWSCHHIAIYVFNSNHTLLLLQKRSDVQSSYITQISLFMANALVCRRIGQSSNKLKSSAIELSLAEALKPPLTPDHHCQIHWWPHSA